MNHFMRLLSRFPYPWTKLRNNGGIAFASSLNCVAGATEFIKVKIQKILFLSLLCISNTALSVSSKLETVAAYYHQNEFDHAYTILKDIHPKSATIWYNMGNCAYKKNDLDHALACWNCAHALAADEVKETVQYNIDVVEKKLNRNKQAGFLEKIVIWHRSLALIIFQFLFLISWFLLLVFIKKYKSGTKYKSIFFGLLLFMVMVSGIALGFKYRTINQRRGIVMKHNVSLFAGPDEQYHVLGSLDGVSEVVVRECRPLWCKIATEQGSGWVMQDSIVVI